MAWQRARSLNNELFKTFSNTKDFTFRHQILRASLSVTNNIAEGFDRGTDKELKQFLTIARGSAAEVRSMLYTGLDVGYISSEQHDSLLLAAEEVGRLLTGFIKKLTPPRRL